MTTREAIRVLTEQEAVAKLEAAGYTRQPCAHCKGEGRHSIPAKDGNDWAQVICSRCEGAGKIWNPPQTR